MLGLVACLCATLIGTKIWQLWRAYVTNIEQAKLVTSNFAQVIAEQAESVVRTADTIVANLVDRIEAEGTGPVAIARLYRFMSSLAVALPAIHEMEITDTQGNAIVKSLMQNSVGLNYADREYFRFHATHPDRVPFIDAPIKSKVDGSYNITVTRRVNRPDGSFNGVVTASIALEYFQRLFDQMQVKSGGVIALLAEDGAILARSPAVTAEMSTFLGRRELGQQMEGKLLAGSLAYVSPLDDVRRYDLLRIAKRFLVSADTLVFGTLLVV
jgi:hypothetical protein